MLTRHQKIMFKKKRARAPRDSSQRSEIVPLPPPPPAPCLEDSQISPRHRYLPYCKLVSMLAVFKISSSTASHVVCTERCRVDMHVYVAINKKDFHEGVLHSENRENRTYRYFFNLSRRCWVSCTPRRSAHPSLGAPLARCPTSVCAHFYIL